MQTTPFSDIVFKDIKPEKKLHLRSSTINLNVNMNKFIDDLTRRIRKIGMINITGVVKCTSQVIYIGDIDSYQNEEWPNAIIDFDKNEDECLVFEHTKSGKLSRSLTHTEGWIVLAMYSINIIINVRTKAIMINRSDSIWKLYSTPNKKSTVLTEMEYCIGNDIYCQLCCYSFDQKEGVIQNVYDIVRDCDGMDPTYIDKDAKLIMEGEWKCNSLTIKNWY
jgi:hypothetical protein